MSRVTRRPPARDLEELLPRARHPRFGRIDYRLGEDGRIYLLEVNALPSLEKGAGLFAAAGHAGLAYEHAISAIVNSALLR